MISYYCHHHGSTPPQLRYPIGSMETVVARQSGINFEMYGAAALMMRLPYLRTRLEGSSTKGPPHSGFMLGLWRGCGLP